MRGIIVSSIIIVIKRERDYEKKGDVKKKVLLKKISILITVETYDTIRKDIKKVISDFV